MKYTITLLPWKHDPDEFDRFPIYLSIYIDGDTRYLSTGHYINPNEWSEEKEQLKEGNGNAQWINPEIASLKSSVIQQLAELQVKGQSISAEALKKQLKAKYNKHNFFDFADSFIKSVKKKRSAGTLENYRKHLLKLELYHKSRSLNLEDITSKYLTDYETSLWDEGLSNNYIHLLVRTVGMFILEAVDKKLITKNPFDDYEMVEYKPPDKAYLTLQELTRWEKFAYQVKDDSERQAAIYYLFGCYTGMRISDWKRFDYEKHIVGDSIRLRPKKTGWVTMPISKPLRRVLAIIKNYPLKLAEQTINDQLKIIAAYDKVKIAKHLTTHTARHTFAITLCAERGISAETCAELMGITVQVCVETYYKVTGYKIMNETLKAWKGLK